MRVTPSATTLRDLRRERVEVGGVRVADREPRRDAPGELHPRSRGSARRARRAARAPRRRTGRATRAAGAGRPWARRRTCSCPRAPRKSMSASRCSWRPGVAVEALDDAADRERRGRHRGPEPGREVLVDRVAAGDVAAREDLGHDAAPSEPLGDLGDERVRDRGADDGRGRSDPRRQPVDRDRRVARRRRRCR